MHSDFDLEFVWHDELIGLDGVKVGFLLVLSSHLLLSVLLIHIHLLLLNILLLIWVHLTNHLLLLHLLSVLLLVNHLLLLLAVHVCWLFLDHLLASHVLSGFLHLGLWLLGFATLDWRLVLFSNLITHFYYNFITSNNLFQILIITSYFNSL